MTFLLKPDQLRPTPLPRNRSMTLVTLIQLLIIITFLAANPAHSSSESQGFDHSHGRWGTLLSQHVIWSDKNSLVSYRGFKRDFNKLSEYLNSLSAVSNQEYANWTKDEQLAFLINAYNAFTVKLVIDHYPVKSIKDIGGLFSSPWKRSFFKLLGEERSLDWLEHQKIRVDFKEPRIHFALNCASKGCPGLDPKPFVASRLHEQLEKATQQFLSDTSRNNINDSSNTLLLSPIFKWYRKDFDGASGSVQKFVAPFMAGQAKGVEIHKLKIRYSVYDWTLNDLRP